MTRKEWMEHVAEIATPLLARLAHGLQTLDVDSIKEMKILVVVDAGSPGEKATVCEITDGCCKCPECLAAAVQAMVTAMGLGGRVELKEVSAEVLH